MIVKITGLIIVFGACAVTGTDFSGRLRRNRRQAALMGQYWGDFLRQMELTAAPPGLIARTLAERSSFPESRQGTLYRRLGVLGGLALVVLLM